MAETSADLPIAAVLFDFGGVITSSPFEAFAGFEDERGLPQGFIRQLNSLNPHDNAWARLERNQVTIEEFFELYEAEAREAGHELDARAVLALLGGDLRPQMVEAVRRCGERMAIGCLTNNFVLDRTTRPDIAEVLDLFDVIVESSRAGVRKPEPRFYELACQELAIQPGQAVFLDDLGINLKPARQMGMTTIKVTSTEQALADLEEVLGFPLAD
jgi:putative hydrolase of the HAD superfamily